MAGRSEGRFAGFVEQLSKTLLDAFSQFSDGRHASRSVLGCERSPTVAAFRPTRVACSMGSVATCRRAWRRAGDPRPEDFGVTGRSLAMRPGRTRARRTIRSRRPLAAPQNALQTGGPDPPQPTTLNVLHKEDPRVQRDPQWRRGAIGPSVSRIAARHRHAGIGDG